MAPERTWIHSIQGHTLMAGDQRQTPPTSPRVEGKVPGLSWATAVPFSVKLLKFNCEGEFERTPTLRSHGVDIGPWKRDSVPTRRQPE